MVNAPDPIQSVEPVDHIWWLMQSIMYSVEQTFDSYGIELPSLRYLTLGNQPVHDCEQVTVAFLQSYLGSPGIQEEGPQRCDGPRTGIFHVEVVRCVPQAIEGYLGRGGSTGSTGPNADEMFDYTRSRGRDLWALLESAGGLNDFNMAIADASVSEPNTHQAAVLNLVVQL